ncbi:MAG: hypothetical protein ABI041_17530 [Bdellovibrionia bacterium]
MKKYLFVIIVLLGLSRIEVAGAASGNWPKPEILNLVPEKVFIPTPFDSNKDVEILITGKFMNSCFRAGKATAQVDSERKIIYVNNQVYFYESSWCLQVIQSYFHTINLGPLSPGDYQIVTWDNQGLEHVFGRFSVFLAQE